MKHILFSLFMIGATLSFTSCTKDSPEIQAQKKQLEGDWTYDAVSVRRSGTTNEIDVTADFDQYTFTFDDKGKLTRRNAENNRTEDGKWSLESASMTTSEGVTLTTGQKLTLNLKEELFGNNIDEEWNNVVVGESTLTGEHSKDGKLYTIRLRKVN
ncbi:MAG: hypothetical protein ACK4WD_09550 [Flavobacteriales bacterium]|jgi:lipopolysaccharide export LptBFGC system permease protein LptF